MTPIQKQIQENFKRLEKMKKSLDIRPKMELTITNGKPSSTFDLRSLNQEIVNNKKLTNS